MGDIAIQQLDQVRFFIALSGLVRYVGSQVECERRAEILLRTNDRAAQDRALLRCVSQSG